MNNNTIPAGHHAPLMARALVPREMLSWALIAVTLGGLEGGLVAVLVKSLYAEAAPALLVNGAVALVAGAPAFANVLSFAFADRSRGRDKVRWLTVLMTACSICVLVVAAAPRNAAGLVLLCAAMVAARVFWSAIVTIRATVWRANFPRHVRARIAGQMTTLASVLIGSSSAVLGVLLDTAPGLARVAWAAAGIAGLGAAWNYRRAKVRRHGALRRQEVASGLGASLRQRMGEFRQLLREDRPFRRYMQCMFLFGGGNLMLMAPLIVILNEHFAMRRMLQVLLTSSLPLALLALSVPLWARLLDNAHIIPYRARQSWTFVLAIGLFAIACATDYQPLLWCGGAALGIAFGGGVLGWNLGHNDFASDRSSTLYMGVHVTLTGVRGLVMPALGVAVYEAMEWWQPGSGRYALFVPLALSTSGAAWFVILARQYR